MKEKLSLLTELIKLARCDHQVREQEYQFLLTIAQSLEVSREEFDSLFETISHSRLPNLSLIGYCSSTGWCCL